MSTASDNAEMVEAGRPDPASFRNARPVHTFESAAVLDAVLPQTVLLPIAGALLVRFRGKFTFAGTLHFEYRRNVPDHATAYTAAPIPVADVAVVANTGFSVDINPGGEAVLAVTWTPDGVHAAVVTFFDVMQQ